ncbi:MAG TPA: hypothetical protein PK691_03185 [Thermomicrobiales bacterium]|nr:hypothetical protein [Thermomicrobiales bacterium]
MEPAVAPIMPAPGSGTVAAHLGNLRSRWHRATVAERFMLALLLLFMIKQIGNVILFPPFTGHDEVAHYAYTRTVATEHRVPIIPDLKAWRTAWEAQEPRPGDILPTDLFRYCRYVLDWNYCDEPTWENNPPVAVTLAGQIYPHGWQYAANHPPLFYLLMTPLYLATDSFSPAQQQYVMRAATIPLGMAIVLLTFLIARLLFLRDQFIQVIVTAGQ